MSPKISIIIPVYNSASFLSRCIDSILYQTFNDIEIILVDDGSKDDSFEICKTYAEKYCKISAYSKENSGPSETRAYGVKQAIGDWICFVDSDDALPTNALESLYSKAITSEADIVSGGWYKILPNGEKVIRRICVSGRLTPKQYIKSLLTLRCYAGPVGKIFKKNLFDEHTFDIDKQIKHNEDLLMNIHLALNSKHVEVYPMMEVYWYYTNEGSITHQPVQIEMWGKVMQELDKCLGEKNRKIIDYYIATVVYKNWEEGRLDKLKPSFIYNRLVEDKRLFHIWSGTYFYTLCITRSCKFYTYLLLLYKVTRFLRFKIQQYQIYK